MAKGAGRKQVRLPVETVLQLMRECHFRAARILKAVEQMIDGGIKLETEEEIGMMFGMVAEAHRSSRMACDFAAAAAPFVHAKLLPVKHKKKPAGSMDIPITLDLPQAMVERWRRLLNRP
jgi:hypothetical protein